jgi:phosphatidylserine decarboxylase
MVKTLLFTESPYISIVVILGILIGYLKYKPLMYSSIVLLCLLIAFYRHYDYTKTHQDNEIICPADGVITNIIDDKDKVLISITLDVFNIHSQIYPCNGTVVDRIYDLNGVYKIIDGSGKSDKNEKKIHIIQTKYGIVKVLQIAGFLVRRIVSSDKIPEPVQGGEYLGMIKFGSRVDVEVSKSHSFDLKVKNGDRVYIGDLLGNYRI